jgi:hypothetical protein
VDAGLDRAARRLFDLRDLGIRQLFDLGQDERRHLLRRQCGQRGS